jgi:MFS family permease
MCLAPRLPDVKANLGISTTYFGFLMSTGSLGALTSMLTIGHIIHRVGVYKVLVISSTVTYLTIAILIELSSPLLFIVVNVTCGFAWASYHIAINAQALHRQSESGRQIIPMLHGLWSAGAVTTAFIALLISSFVSLNWHILTLVLIVYLLTINSINASKQVLLKGNEVNESDEVVTFKTMISSFTLIG